MPFPTALPSYTDPTPGQTLDAGNHTALHIQNDADIIALATKMGTGASTPTSGMLLRGNGVGTSVWGQAALTTDVTGVLPVANGGTGQATLTGLPLASPAISGTVSGGATYSSPTLITPIIADFTNATHTHASNAQGGQLTGSAALVNSTVTADKLATGAAKAYVATSEATASTSYVDLTTTTDSVTVTIGANGLALVSIKARAVQNTAAAVVGISFTVSGASTVAANDENGAYIQTPGIGYVVQLNSVVLVTGLTPGSNTFKMKYAVTDGGSGSGTATFSIRRISVVPL